MKITEEHIEFVSKANGYCKKMDYQKGSTEYNIAWLAYMAGISNNGEHWYLKHLKSDKTIGDLKEYLNENAAGICKNCKTDLPEEQIEDDEQDFECCSDCDNHDACEDFGCAVKQGIAIKYI